MLYGREATLERFARLVPESLLGFSGEVFYSGRAAFSGTRRVSLLGTVELQPVTTNPEHKPIAIGHTTEDAEIVGIVVGATIGTRQGSG